MGRSSDEFRITLPPEERWENRVEHGHTRSQWMALQERFNHRCAYCGIRKQDTPEGYLCRDHILALYYGGTDKIDNIAPACVRCNKLKRVHRPGDWCGIAVVPQPKPRKRFRRWWT